MLRLSALSLFTAVLCAPAPAARAADDDPKAIITRAIKAHGGEDFLTKRTAARLQNKGKINIPGVGESEFTQELIYMIPDKIKDNLELSIGGQKIAIVTVMNGDKISIEAAGKAVPITDDIKKAMKNATKMLQASRLVPLLKDKKYELAIFGEDKVDGKPVLGVRVSAKGEKDITLFFDKATGLLAKLEHRTVEANTGNEITEERIISEYKKDKDGIPLPKKVLVKHDGKTFLEAECVEVEYLEKIDESEFKK